MITIRRMRNAEIERIAEVDRSEHVTKIYVNSDGTLIRKDVDWRIPRWLLVGPPQQALPEEINPEEHTAPPEITIWRPMLAEGSVLFGAFDDITLVGFVIYRPNLSKDTAQLAALYVSKNYRRQGIGALLTDKVCQLARADGAKKLYVSATPTAPTVHFYMGQGFKLTQEINQQLYELEPDDIHMTKNL